MLAHSQMLRASAQITSVPLDARSIADPDVDSLVPAGNLLIRFVDAVLGNEADLNGLRDTVLGAVAPSGLVDTAGVIGNSEWRARLGLDRFSHLAR